MTNIIALVDGSTYSASVCDHAAWLAERLDASIEITHVLGRRNTDSKPQNLSGNITLGARSALLAELTALDEQRNKLAQKRGRAILEDAQALIDSKGSATITTTLRIEDIVDTVTNSDADIVLLGKRGEAADFAKLHLGSNLERIARASHQPLFIASRA
ncbi:MAG: universal stress protein, partial [Alphaproteobacteria bacterium]|nr:universal stress protein [Alphaproteobacteria bacterium]